MSDISRSSLQEGKRLVLQLEELETPTIRAAGELDFENCHELQQLLADGLAEKSTIQLDMGELDFVDSSGLRVLVVAALAARRAGGMVRLLSISSQMQRMLAMSGFDGLFDIVTDQVKPVGLPAVRERTALPLHFSLVANTEACRAARNRVCAYAFDLGFQTAALEDIRLAVGEAVSNAVRHGCCRDECIRMECNHNNGRLKVVLRYPSTVFDPDTGIPTIDESADGGMGIYFIRLVMDSATYSFGDGYVTVALEKSVDAQPAANCPPMRSS